LYLSYRFVSGWARTCVGGVLLGYSICMGAEVRWTDEAILRESERWVHVPWDGTRLEDGRRLLVYLPGRWGTIRVWRTRAADESLAGDIIEETIREVLTAGGGRILWHTGDRIAPPFMDECLAGHGFEMTEELDVLAFVLRDDSGPRLPWLAVPGGVNVWLARDAGVIREVLGVDSEVFGSASPSAGEIAEYAGELEKLGRLERGESLGECTSLALRFAASIEVVSGYEGDDVRRVVAAAGSQLIGETLRLWGAATLEEFRGRGAYKALVLERCRVGTDLGATLAITKANVATSSSILKRAGFRRVGTERRHVLEIQ
jgi:hypothetical protein